MVFINELKFEKIEGLLDTEEKVKEARETLERSTVASFKELEKAKMASWDGAQRIFLD
jgi:hydroxymethylglutaryl-CoA reductase